MGVTPGRGNRILQAISTHSGKPAKHPSGDPPNGARISASTGLLAPTLFCGVVLLTLLGLTFALWRHEVNEIHDDVHADTALVCEQVVRRFEAVLDDRLTPLRKLESKARGATFANLPNFEQEAQTVVDGSDWLRLAALVNTSYFCRAAAASPGALNPRRIRLNRDSDQFVRFTTTLRKAFESERESIAAYRSSDDEGAEAIFAVPIQGEAGKAGNGGALLFDIALDKLLAPMFDPETAKQFVVSVTADGQSPIYVRANEPAKPHLAASNPIHVADQEWLLSLTPTERFVAERERHTPTGVLIAGCLIAFCVSGALWQTMTHRRRDRRAAESHLAALTALNDISLAISSNPEATQEVFAHLTRTACDLLGMSSASITLLNSADQTMHVAHRRNLTIEPERTVYRLDELPMCKQCMETKQVMFAQDIWKYPGPFKTDRYKALNVRSIVVVPFLAQDKPVGAMVLSDSRAKRFSSAQRQMAAIWGAQAAVTISNQGLYQRMTQAMGTQKRVLEKLKMLYTINTQIQHADTLEQSLQMMADLSPSTLDVDCTIICLRDDDCAPGFVRIGGATKGTSAEQFVGQDMRCCVHCSDVLATGTPLVIESAAGDPILRETALAPWGSAAFLPLVTSGSAPFGFVVLMRQAAIPFTPEETQFAQLFATRAAVVIENTRLYEQTRRDAEAKAMLLRELNHRVKNNLAAIVGLLSTKPADLSLSAQRWIDRATQRIATIARTHDLFSGGISEVSLQELASKALASVDAIKPPGVRVRAELDNLDVQLSTDRAVTLAMVLYELCCNALVHGMGESGQLVLRGRNIDGERVAIDVIDSGSETGVLAAGKAIVRDGEVTALTRTNGASHGIGLSLVQGLVGRELHGRFDLRQNPSGGSTATVEFPINGKTPPRV
jgi:two-component sensor histidine kinase